MRLVCISDTHGRHRQASLPGGDLLIHAGDASNGRRQELEDFLDWFIAQPHPQKIFISGNMDYALEAEPEKLLKDIPANVHYLQDEGLTIGGMAFWGSPHVPHFVGVFNLPRGEALRKVWAGIPDKVDVLITHTPPFGILDKTSLGRHVGCEALMQRLKSLKPRLHLFGHVHESYGQTKEGGTLYLNASLPGGGFGGLNEPVVVDLED